MAGKEWMKAHTSTSRASKGPMKHDLDTLAADLNELEFLELVAWRKRAGVIARKMEFPEDVKVGVVWDFEEELKALGGQLEIWEK